MSRPRTSSTIRVNGPSGRPGVGRAGLQVEPALVAWTGETALGRSRNHRARQMRALLIERDELANREVHQEAGLVFIWIRKAHRPADRKLVDRRDPLNRRLPAALSIPIVDADRDLSQRERRAGQDEEF